MTQKFKTQKESQHMLWNMFEINWISRCVITLCKHDIIGSSLKNIDVKTQKKLQTYKHV